MTRTTCARRGCAIVVRRRPKHYHNERRLLASAAAFARERDLLTDDGHAVMCIPHRLEIGHLFLQAAAAAPATSAPQPTSPSPPAPSSSLSSSSSSARDPYDERMLAATALLSASQQWMATATPTSTPALAAQRLPPPQEEPRVLRALTGHEVEERSQPRRRRTMKERAIAGRALGGCRLPLSLVTTLLNRTQCDAWDGEDDVTGGRPGCRALMHAEGSRERGGNVEILLMCTGEDCDREVVVSNHQYDLPSHERRAEQQCARRRWLVR